MVNESELVSLIQEAKKSEKERKFTQSLELYLIFKDIDVKKGFALNEIIQLPKQMSQPAAICVMATGDMGVKAKNANADQVIDGDELNKLAENKRETRKLINKYDFFLADTKLMANVGKSLGQLLGPRGKMPTPIPYNAPIDSFLDRFRSSIRVKSKGSLSMACKIGEENMDDTDIAANANIVATTIEKKLPNWEKNIKKIMFKTTMGKIIKIDQAKK